MRDHVLISGCYALSIVSFMGSAYLLWATQKVAQAAVNTASDVQATREDPAARGVFDFTAAAKAIGELVAVLTKSAPYLSYLAASILFMALALYGNGTLTQREASPKAEKTAAARGQPTAGATATSPSGAASPDPTMNLPVKR